MAEMFNFEKMVAAHSGANSLKQNNNSQVKGTVEKVVLECPAFGGVFAIFLNSLAPNYLIFEKNRPYGHPDLDFFNTP
jgi:hypothetical protein